MTTLELDRAIRSPQEDRLKRRTFVQSLATRLILDQTSTGVVVGLIGPWGCGKTSILNLLEHELSINKHHGSPLIVRFNPWLISSRDDLIGHFFLELTRSLRDRTGHYDVYNSGSDQLKDRAIAAISDYGTALSPVLNVVMPRFGHGVSLLQKLAERKKASTSSIHAKKELVAKCLQSFDFPIVVLIDEMDRLEDEEVRSMAQLLRSVGDFRSISYLAAYDEERVIEALSAGSPTADRDRGHAYLEKIIQIRASVPEIPFTEIEAIFREDLINLLNYSNIILDNRQIDRLGELIKIIVPPYVSTPRDMKKVLSDFGGRIIGLEKTVDCVDLLALCVLDMKASTAYKQIISTHSSREHSLTFDNLSFAYSFHQTTVLPQMNLIRFGKADRPKHEVELLEFVFPHALTGKIERQDIQPKRVIFSRPLSFAIGQNQEKYRHHSKSVRSFVKSFFGSRERSIQTKLRSRTFVQSIDHIEHEFFSYDYMNSKHLIINLCEYLRQFTNDPDGDTISSIEALKVASLIMRLQDRLPQSRSILRQEATNDLNSEKFVLASLFCVDQGFVSAAQQVWPGFYWEAATPAYKIEHLARIAHGTFDSQFATAWALPLVLTKERSPGKEVVSENQISDLIDQGLTNSNFCQDFIDLFFANELWGDRTPETLLNSLFSKNVIRSIVDTTKRRSNEVELTRLKPAMSKAQKYIEH